MLHRDVKPANILVTPEGSPKLADFNISFSDKVTGATPAAYFGGSLAYMSPEQLEACQPSASRAGPRSSIGRSDLYSLGIVLWELLTGFRPFRDEAVEGGWSADAGRHDRAARGADRHVGARPSCPDVPKVCRRSWKRRSPPIATSAGRAAWRWPVAWSCAPTPRPCGCSSRRKRSLRVRLRKYAVLIVFVAAGLPNVLAGVFNYVHNLSEIVVETRTDRGPLFSARRP